MQIESFFSREDLDVMRGAKIETDLHGPDCSRCKLYEGAISPRMKHTGEGEKGVLIIAEQPGPDEDKDNTQLIGRTGQWFRQKLRMRGLKLDRDFWKINAVNCYSENKPTNTQVQCCKPLVDNTIKELNPDMIWLLGEYALRSFYMGRFKEKKPTRWRNLCIPDRDTQAWIVPMFHPSFATRNDKDPNIMATYDRDLDHAVSWIGREFPKLGGENQCIQVLTDVSEICKMLDYIIDAEWNIFHDYETNSKKPYWPKSKALTMSIATSSDKAYSFPLKYRSHFTPQQYARIKKRIRKIMLNPNIHKRAHNLQFENSWTRNMFGVVPTSTDWCTMVTAHVIDGRRKYTGLKFQSYLHWGMPEYDKEIKPYKRGHPYNKMEQVDLYDLLHYGGLDSLLGQRLLEIQVKTVPELGLDRPRLFHHEGLIAMGETQDEGIPVDEEYYEEQASKLQRRIDVLEKRLLKGEEAEKFRRKIGKQLDLESNKDLQALFFNVLELEPIKATKTGYAVDEDVMRKLGIPFTEKLLRLKKIRKQRNTYVLQFLRETHEGKMHPSVNLHIARSYRSSYSDPNFQNIPVRDEEAKKVTRSGIIPSSGNQIGETDYGSQEVRIAACHSKDPVLIKYVEDPTTDMHRDQATNLFHLTTKQMTETLRFYTKNCFVFPQFYGSWYKLCAADLWENCMKLRTGEGRSVLAHLKDVGIVATTRTAYDDFEQHVKHCEDKFWELYEVHNEWINRKMREFQDKGYVETFFGFRRGGYLKKNKISNTPIQADAYHCLQWTYVKLVERRKKEKWQSKILGQIHDSTVFDFHPPEVEHILRTVKQIGAEEIRREQDWIIVPLQIDAELTPIEGTWYDKKSINNNGYHVDRDGNKTLMTWREIEW
jgi:uracil-DNA glycosylase family 4